MISSTQLDLLPINLVFRIKGFVNFLGSFSKPVVMYVTIRHKYATQIALPLHWSYAVSENKATVNIWISITNKQFYLEYIWKYHKIEGSTLHKFCDISTKRRALIHKSQWAWFFNRGNLLPLKIFHVLWTNDSILRWQAFLQKKKKNAINPLGVSVAGPVYLKSYF
jgi:hypothetical protein